MPIYVTASDHGVVREIENRFDIFEAMRIRESFMLSISNHMFLRKRNNMEHGVEGYPDLIETTHEIEVKHRASCVWHIAGFNATEAEIREQCKWYSITYEQAMMWKDYWKHLTELSIAKEKQNGNHND